MNYEGWTIHSVQDEAGFGDLEGYDVEKSISKFCDVLEHELNRQFHGADIQVSYERKLWNGGKTYVYGTDEAFHNYGYTDSDERIREEVESIASDIFTDRADEWTVEKQ